MLQVNNLVGFGGGSASPTTLTYVSSNSRDGGGISSWTSSSQDIGSNADGNFLVILVCCFNAAASANDITGVTVGGNSADLEVGTAGTSADVRIFTIEAPAGSTADIVLTCGGNNTTYGVGVYRLIAADSKTPSDTDTATPGGTPNDMVLNVPENGAAIAARFQVNGALTTWTGLATKDFDFDTRSSEYWTGAHEEGLAADATYDISVGGTPDGSYMVAASWA